MRKYWIFALIGLFMMGMGPVALGDSLWNNSSRPLITNERVFKVGDLLTIRISEQSSASNQVATNGSEKNTFLMGPGSGKLKKLIPLMGADEENGYTGTGQTARAGALTARLTVTITSIDTNGTLNVEGRQVIKVNKDEQNLHVKGRIRPQDVLADNSVVSSYIADADIEYKGTGSGESGQPGIISRILSWLF
jgi:flagellar L-ring protein precursor FlgH